MTKNANYIDKMITSAVDAMEKEEFYWPRNWTLADKQKFCKDCLQWLNENELYERSQIILNVQKKL